MTIFRLGLFAVTLCAIVIGAGCAADTPGPSAAERENARKNNVILGLFLFGTARVGEFLEKGFTFISVGNDLHHMLTQATSYVKDMEDIAKTKGKSWARRPTALM